MGILRLLLALSVVATHAGPIIGTTFVGGQVAVEAFYIISGFYMTLILNEKYIDINNSYRLFISNRLLKLYPIYWAIVTLILLLSLGSLIANSFAGKLHSYFDYYHQYGNMSFFSISYLVITNLALVGQDAIMFLGIDTQTGQFFFTSDFSKTQPQLTSFLLVPQAWTLGIEIIFYLIAPFIVRRNFMIFIVLVASFLVKMVLPQFGLDHDPWTYRFFPAELMFFLLGSVSYKLYRLKKKWRFDKLISVVALTVISLLILFYDFWHFSDKYPFFFILLTLSIPLIFSFTKNLKWDTRLGDLSYPIYISHMLVFYAVMNDHFPKLISRGTTLAICSILFSLLLNKYISSPVEKFRQSRLRPQ